MPVRKDNVSNLGAFFRAASTNGLDHCIVCRHCFSTIEDTVSSLLLLAFLLQMMSFTYRGIDTVFAFEVWTRLTGDTVPKESYEKMCHAKIPNGSLRGGRTNFWFNASK